MNEKLRGGRKRWGKNAKRLQITPDTSLVEVLGGASPRKKNSD
jgi:hypothetical protein